MDMTAIVITLIICMTIGIIAVSGGDEKGRK